MSCSAAVERDRRRAERRRRGGRPLPATRRRPRRPPPRHRARGPRRRDLRGRAGAAHRRAAAPAGRQGRRQLSRRRPATDAPRAACTRPTPKSGDGPWWEGPSHGRRQAADPGCRCKPGGGNLVGDTEHITALVRGKQARTVSRVAALACRVAGAAPAASGAGSTGRCPPARSARTPGCWAKHTRRPWRIMRRLKSPRSAAGR